MNGVTTRNRPSKNNLSNIFFLNPHHPLNPPKSVDTRMKGYNDGLKRKTISFVTKMEKNVKTVEHRHFQRQKSQHGSELKTTGQQSLGANPIKLFTPVIDTFL